MRLWKVWLDEICPASCGQARGFGMHIMHHSSVQWHCVNDLSMVGCSARQVQVSQENVSDRLVGTSINHRRVTAWRMQ